MSTSSSGSGNSRPSTAATVPIATSRLYQPTASSAVTYDDWQNQIKPKTAHRPRAHVVRKPKQTGLSDADWNKYMNGANRTEGENYLRGVTVNGGKQEV